MINNDPLVIATRKSPLAMAQAQWVKNKLANLYPWLNIELLGLTTRADQLLSIPLTQVGGKGLFVKELEEALLNGRAHLAVHSMKDVPMALPAGLALPVICEREDVRDVLIANQYTSIANFPPGARIGTSSLRRQTQLRALRMDLQVENLRGNVNTRLAHLDSQSLDALILAAAGLKRLHLSHRITAFLAVEQMLPAAGQGALALECRADDRRTQQLLAPLNHAVTFACVSAERALCKQLGGGCQAPVAAYAELQDECIDLRALVSTMDGQVILRGRRQAVLPQAQQLGEAVAQDLLQQGAAKILAAY